MSTKHSCTYCGQAAFLSASSVHKKHMLAKSFFGIGKTSGFIERLKSDPSLRLLCGFGQVPDAAAFSRIFSCLAEEEIWSPALDGLAKEAHEGKVVYHV